MTAIDRNIWKTGLVLLVSAIVAGAAILTSDATRPSAPPASDVPLAPGETVLQQAPETFTQAGGPGGPTDRYRYVEIVGPRGMSETALVRAELSALAGTGWRWLGRKTSLMSKLHGLLHPPYTMPELSSESKRVDIYLYVVNATRLRAGVSLYPLSDRLAMHGLEAGRPAIDATLIAAS
jgi:hypothetical protein